MVSLRSSPATLEVTIVRLDDNDRFERLPLDDEGDRADCLRIRPHERRRLFHFRRASQLAVLARSQRNATILRDGERHIRGLLHRGAARHVSCSADTTVCCVAVGSRPVGIDIELSDGRHDLAGLLICLGQAKADDFAGLPPALARFEASVAWTRMEAGLKRAGGGIHALLSGSMASAVEPKGRTKVLACFEWVCAISHANDAAEVTAQVIDFAMLCERSGR